MLKKLVVFALFLIPVGAFAQEVKIAHVNTQEIFNAMPEVSAMESQIASLNKSFTDELKTSENEYNVKYTKFMQEIDSLNESIKVRRMQELEDMKQRIETFYQQARQDVQKEQEKLLAPIQKKIKDAITAVGDEQGYAYIMENGVFLYMSSKSIDATPLVKTKLGLK